MGSVEQSEPCTVQTVCPNRERAKHTNLTKLEPKLNPNETATESYLTNEAKNRGPA